MPRPRITEQEKRERALMRAIGAAKGELGLTYDTQVAELLGISKSQYCHLKKDRFQRAPLYLIIRMVAKLGIPGRDVCDFLGAKYEED